MASSGDAAGQPPAEGPAQAEAPAQAQDAKAVRQGKPSAEEIAAKRAARAAKKAAEQAVKDAKERAFAQARRAQNADDNGEGLSKDEQGQQLFVPRRWRYLHNDADAGKDGIRVLSWNMLAQGLVRRKLFPGSDCLRMADRSAGLSAELLAHRFDIGCFQEVDRTDLHFATLAKGGCAHVYEKGYPQKQHGLMIAWRTTPRRLPDSASQVDGAAPPPPRWSACFEREPLATKTLFLDDEDVTPFLSAPAREARERIGTQQARRASSHKTRNIALFAALKTSAASGEPPVPEESQAENAGRGAEAQHTASSDDTSAADSTSRGGVIVATTHLFWHPMFAYERVRQAGVLLRQLDAFRRSRAEWADWPVILAGDFNDQPHSAMYHFLTGQKLTPHCIEEVQASSVVHHSIDQRAEQEKALANGEATGAGAGAGANAGAADSAASRPATDSAGGDSGEAAADGTATTEAKGDADEEDLEGEGAGGEEDEEEQEGGGADDQMRRNCRPATEKDGLLTIEELAELYGEQPVLSTYGTYNEDEGNFFGTPGRGRERFDDPDWTPNTPNPHEGPCREPMWTIFSSLFSLTLDYIFLLPKANAPAPSADDKAHTSHYPGVAALLDMHRTEVLQPGVPRKTVCASDHVAVGAEIRQ